MGAEADSVRHSCTCKALLFQGVTIFSVSTQNGPRTLVQTHFVVMETEPESLGCDQCDTITKEWLELKLILQAST